MKILKKLFNKLLFAFIVALVFSFVNRSCVKALDGTALDYETYTISYETQVQMDCWYKFGDTFGANGGTGYDFYLCSTNKKVVGYKLSGTANLLSDLNVISFDSYFDYTNVFLYSYSGSNNNTWFLILSEGDLPTLGGSCSSGSYCFNVINTGSQGNGRSATAKSNTILFTNNITYINGTAKFVRRYYTTNEYFGTASPSINLPAGSCSSNSYRTYSTSNIYNVGSYAYSCNLNLFELEDPVPPIPNVIFSDNFVNVGDLKVSDNVLVKIENYDFNTDRYFYQYTDIPDNFDENNFVELYYDNFMFIDNYITTSLHVDNNGYLIIKILRDDEDPIYKSHPIDELMEISPEIELSVDFNSSNTITIDEVLVDINYLTYGKEKVWVNGELVYLDYICQYTFLDNINDSLSNATWTTTDCSSGYLYVSNINGMVASRIVIDDDGYQEVALETYIVDKIGVLVSEMYDTTPSSNNFFGAYVNNNGLIGLFNSSSGPIKSIVALPLRVGTFIFQFFNMPSVCSPYDLGSIFGHHLVIGCVDLSILGSPLLRIIDIIFAGAFTITWLLFLYKLFRKIVLLKNLNIVDMVKGGIF